MPEDTKTTTTPPDALAQPMSAADEARAELAEVRAKAAEWHEAADRSATTRYSERGGALDETTRDARAARTHSEEAQQQAARERQAADELAREAKQYEDEIAQTSDSTTVGDLRDIATSRAKLADAAAKRAERAEQAANESTAKADALDQRVTELTDATNDNSVPVAIGTAANRMDIAGDELQMKVELLDTADEWEADAAKFDAEGDTVSAEIYRERAGEVRAQAEAMRPEIPVLDPRVLEAADSPWGPPDAGSQQPPSADGSGNDAPSDGNTVGDEPMPDDTWPEDENDINPDDIEIDGEGPAQAPAAEDTESEIDMGGDTGTSTDGEAPTGSNSFDVTDPWGTEDSGDSGQVASDPWSNEDPLGGDNFGEDTSFTSEDDLAFNDSQTDDFASGDFQSADFSSADF
ncbi:MAG TPA: hypothetical protein VFP09_00375 [Desertimonas sp.]|nr:hypothetical protein [Desertimonas sp.]